MRNIFLSSILLIASQAKLFANDLTLRYAGHTKSSLDNVVNILEQNAVITLLGAVLLLGLIWLGFVSASCVQLNEPKKAMGRNVPGILLFLAGLSFLSSSCSVEQQLRATEMYVAKSMEGVHCVCVPATNYQQAYSAADINNYYPFHNYSIGGNSPVCKQCGHWINKRSHQ